MVEHAPAPPAVLPVALAHHPAVVLAVSNDVDLLDVVHADVGGEHRPIRVPRQPVGVPEAVRVDLAKRPGVAVGREPVGHRNGVVPKPLRALRHRGTARIETEDRGHDGVEALRLAGGVRVRSPAVAEAVIAPAGVQQSVVRIAGLRRGVELHRAHRVRQVRDDVRFAKQFASGPLERGGRRVGGVPLRDHVVVGHVFQGKAGRDEVGRPGIPRGSLAVHGVEESVSCELRMKDEPDESALEPVINRMRKHRANVRIDARFAIGADQVEKAAGIVGEAAAVGKIAHKVDARPARGRHVLIRADESRAYREGARGP